MKIQMKWLDDTDSIIKSIDCLQFNVPCELFLNSILSSKLEIKLAFHEILMHQIFQINV